MLAPGDLFASLKGATKDGEMIGSVACVPESVPSGRLTQDTVKLKFRRRDHDFERYVYWMLRTPQYRAYCAGRATGSAVVALSRDDFLAYAFPLPTAGRTHCVRLLDNIERRVTLLRQTNATLESIAQALFKSWFIDFGPARAKAEGRQPEGMDALTAALFPAEFERSELGPVPKGWTVQPIGDLVEAVGGSTPDTRNETFWEPGVHHWTSPKDLSGATAPVLLDTERKVSDPGLSKISSGLLPAGTLLMSSRAPIGYLSLSQIPVAINQGYIAMLPGSRLPPTYMYFWCQLNMDAIKGRANGSTFMEISKKAFRPIPAVLPSPEVVNRFNDFATAVFSRVTSNERQARALAELRDTLLPRLISGKLQLQDVSNQSEEALA
jgi:type I restriction enzyme S subunit